MEYINKTLEFSVKEPSVITLGKFDGLHRGHELLMENLKNKRHDDNLKAIVFTFDVPPANKVNHKSSFVLTTNKEKHQIFEQQGVDYLIECPFTDQVMNMEAEQFVKWIVESLNIKCIIVGNDFCFGHNRSGDYKLLMDLADKYGYEIIVIDKMKEDGRDISSTFIREEIEKGNISKANHLLGYEYFVKSEIIHGKQIGRTIGIPTINMILPKEKLLPPLGVYVTRVSIGERWYMGVSNVGCKPTIEGINPIGVETYIIDFCQDLYGQEVTVSFLEFIRPERKFESLDALKNQMNNDIIWTEKYYRNVTN